jgi:hypothetical protein
MQSIQTESEQFHRLQLAAYFLWEERGCPIGTPEIDWFRAEHELRNNSPDAAEKPALVAVAEGVGSVIGSIAGLVASVEKLVHSEDDQLRS